MGSAPRTKVEDRLYTANEGPLHEQLGFHHEMSLAFLLPFSKRATGKMNPKNIATTSLSVAVWPRDSSVDAGDECFLHGFLVNLSTVTSAFGYAHCIRGFQIFSYSNMLAGLHSLKAPLICLALGPVADRSRTVVAASCASRPSYPEPPLIHPEAAAPRKNLSALEGSPCISMLYLGTQEMKALQSSSPLSSEIYKGWSRIAGARSDPDLHEDSLVFQIQVNLSGKTSMQWVRATDLVQDLLQNLEGQLGIPSSCLRLVYKGKQHSTTLPFSFYSIQRDASIVATFHLRGGSFRQTSYAPPFSFKDVVRKDVAHSQPSSSADHPFEAPKPFLVDKSEDIPSINLSHPGIDDHYQLYAEAALVCRFNGLWPRTSELYQWIHTNWTKKCEIHLCSKGFFIVVFDRNEDYQKALTGGPWFWGSAGLFLTPWFPDFDPSTDVITKTPIWVRLPNLPAHLWHVSVFITITETLGCYLAVDSSRKENGLY